MAHMTYVTGGARSGKSSFAQSLAESCSGPLLYVATAAVLDDEMAERVRLHRHVRGDRWSTLEEPMDLAEKLPQAAEGKGGILLDCLTLWTTNLLFHHREEKEPIMEEVRRFLACLPEVEAPLFVVSNEVGLGIVPENRLARLFRDLAGEVNQAVAAAADEAYLVASGIPLRLK